MQLNWRSITPRKGVHFTTKIWNTSFSILWNNVTKCIMCINTKASIMLQSAVGMTHDLRSDLWWTIPLRILLGQFSGPLPLRSLLHGLLSRVHFGESLVIRLYSEIDQIHLSSEAQCVSYHYPRWTATTSFNMHCLYLFRYNRPDSAGGDSGLSSIEAQLMNMFQRDFLSLLGTFQ